MLFSISGEDTFRSREFLHQCEAAFRQKHDPEGHHIQRVDGQMAESLESLLADASTFGLFQAKRLMIVEDFFALLKHETESERRRLERIAGFTDTTVIVYHQGKLPKAAVSAFLKAQTYSREFAPLSPEEFRDWVEARFRVLGAVIDARVLAQVVGALLPVSHDLWAVNHEIAKIVYGASSVKIGEQDIERLSYVQDAYSAFALCDALFARDPRRICEQAAEIPEDAFFPLLSLMGGQVRTMFALKEYARGSYGQGAADLLGIHPFVVKKLAPLARETSSTELARESQLLVLGDRIAKSSRIPKGALLIHILFGFLESPYRW